MNEKTDSKWLSLATASILGQPPRGAEALWHGLQRIRDFSEGINSAYQLCEARLRSYL